MIFETISTGDEIARGRSVDSNAPWMARRAAGHGVLRSRHLAVGDDPEALAAAFGEAARRADLVVVTGGLGPTDDDHTRTAAAAAAGVPLVHVPALLEEIVRSLASRNLSVPESSARQAFVPEGAEPLANPVGLAPGFAMDLHGARLFFLSGVPREMESMFDAHVLPLIRERGGGGAYAAVTCFGRPEALVNEDLRDLFRRRDVSVGITATFGLIRVTAQATGAGAAEKVAGVAGEVRRRLGDLVLGADTPAEAAAALLIERGVTLATAESCTGGLVGAMLTDVPGISAVYPGGVVAYADGIKTGRLGVPEETLVAHGAVSEPVARAMAEGVRECFGADLGVAVTGIAGPGGGTPEKPVGLVWYALAAPDGVRALERRLPGDREFVRRVSAHTALDLVRRWLLAVA